MCEEQCEFILNELLYARDLYGYIVKNCCDVEYTVNSDKELTHVDIYITCGGPTNWLSISPNYGEVCSHWGSDEFSVPIPDNIAEQIFYMESEFFLDS